MEGLRAVFVVTFNAAALEMSRPAYAAAKLESFEIYYSIDDGLRFIAEPNLFCPVDTVVVDPPQLRVVHH